MFFLSIIMLSRKWAIIFEGMRSSNIGYPDETDPFGKQYLDIIDKVNALRKENKPSMKIHPGDMKPFLKSKRVESVSYGGSAW